MHDFLSFSFVIVAALGALFAIVLVSVFVGLFFYAFYWDMMARIYKLPNRINLSAKQIRAMFLLKKLNYPAWKSIDGNTAIKIAKENNLWW